MPSIPQPGLTIQQVLQTVTPTIYSPTFPACIVGPCYQIIEMQNSDGSINSSALLNLPPIVLATLASAATTYNVGGLNVRVEVNGTTEDYSFPASSSPLPIATVLSKLNEGYSGKLIWAASSANRLNVKTVATGDAASLMFTAPAASTAHVILGFDAVEDIRYYGNGDYENNPIVFPYMSLPDTRGIIDYLTFDATEINIARIWAGSIITLSSSTAVNRNRYNRVGIAFDRGNGGGFSAGTHTYLGGENFYTSCGEVVDAGTTNVSVALPLYNGTPLTGNEWDLATSPNNQLLWPIGTGSTTDRLLQTGRHAYADIQLSADGVTTSADYHFEAHGYQKYITDQSATPGSARGAFGNQVYIEFDFPNLNNADTIAVLNDGIITNPAPGQSALASGTFNSGGGAGNFLTSDAGRYVYLHTGNAPTTYGSWYQIDPLFVGPAVTAPLFDIATGAYPLVDLTPDTVVVFTMSSGAYTLPHCFAPANVGGNVRLRIECVPSDAVNDWTANVAAAAAPAAVVSAGAFNTEILATTSWETYLGQNTQVGSTMISRLNTGSSSTATINYELNGNTYFLNFGADPYDYTATSVTRCYPYVTGEMAFVDASPFFALQALAGRTITVRINGGPERSHTFTTGVDCSTQALVKTALDALVPGGTPFTWAAIGPFSYGSELYAGTGTLVNTTLTVSSADIAALTYVESDLAIPTVIHAQVWCTDSVATTPMGAGFGVYEVVSAVTPGASTITLGSSLAGAGPHNVGFRLLRTTGNVLTCVLDSTITGNAAGYEASIEFGGDGVDILFRGPHSTSTTSYTNRIFRGDPLRCQIGDKLYNAGSYVGTIGSFPATVWADPTIGNHTVSGSTLVLTEKNATVGTALGTWYITAQGMTGATTEGAPAALITNATTEKPQAEVRFDTTNELITLKGGLNRDPGGIEYASTTAQLAAGYTALRTDITVSGPTPAVQVFSTYAEMSTAIGPVNSSNPLALGVYIAMLNAPNIQVSAFGVDAVSTLMPYGTSPAYATAFDFLQSANVYAIAPMSNSPAVHGLLDGHVTAMADPTTGKSERVCFICEDAPTERTPTTCGSAPYSAAPSSVGAATFELVIDAGTGFNIAAALSGKTDANGATVPIIGSATIANGLYVTREGDPFKYSVSEIKAGNTLKIRVDGFGAGYGPGTSGNDDSFYSTSLVGATADSLAWDADGETVSLYIRQAAIDTTTSTGRAYRAAALASKASNYAYRRVRYVQPSSATYLENGASTSIHGMYTCAALAGMCSSTAPQQSFSTLTLAGIESVSGSWDLLSTNDMDTAAGGGVWWLTQQDSYSAVATRHQLTTDVTSLQTREASVTHVLDYITKRLRVSMQGLAGKFNLTKSFLDYVSILVNTIIRGMNGTIVSRIAVTSIRIDPQILDTMYVDIAVVPYYPANQINVTLVV